MTRGQRQSQGGAGVMKALTAYVLVDRFGDPCIESARNSPHNVRAWAKKFFGHPWADLYRRGFRVIRVTVTPDKVTP